MKALFNVAVVFVISLCGCSDDGASPSPDAFTSALDDAAATDASIAVTFQSGRWTSGDGFEDPFEAELRFEGGSLSGRVCGPSMALRSSSLDGANCGPIDDAGISGRTVHFSYVLPYAEWDKQPRAFDVFGVLNDEGTEISASLRFNDEQQPKTSHWLHCPKPTQFCVPPQ